MMANSPSGEPDEPATCSVCGTDLEWITCTHCGGEGDFDLHDEDGVNYAPGEEYEQCELCEGNGGWLQCPCLPHGTLPAAQPKGSE